MVAGTGGPFRNTGGKPDTGPIDGLTVIYGDLIPTTAYSITGLAATFDGLQTSLNAFGATDTFRAMFIQDDKITGSGGDTSSGTPATTPFTAATARTDRTATRATTISSATTAMIT
jgi:hypothetical protein